MCVCACLRADRRVIDQWRISDYIWSFWGKLRISMIITPLLEIFFTLFWNSPLIICYFLLFGFLSFSTITFKLIFYLILELTTFECFDNLLFWIKVFLIWRISKLDSHLLKKLFYINQWKPFTIDKRCFLFHLKSSFRSPDI